ncbi:hypothetical protein [Mesorhizobium sp. KR9-304]|uniref:hypothetical protein n=1 Tax=Mesorhizobium sp. KR9-304 TaxID=3156614 RepID=UPI0032B61E98
MDLRFKDELALMPDLRHRLRRLRWFRLTFRSHARLVGSTYGLRFEIDDARLTKAFLDWVETMEKRKDFAKVDRADFVIFAAGLVLRELIRQEPAKVVERALQQPLVSAGPEMAEIVEFWPEGFLYTNFCVSAIAAIYEQEFGEAPAIDKCADDLRTWWSYRENVSEMPAYAVAFLDRFLGGEPNWLLPDDPHSRPAIVEALETPDHRRLAYRH